MTTPTDNTMRPILRIAESTVRLMARLSGFGPSGAQRNCASIGFHEAGHARLRPSDALQMASQLAPLRFCALSRAAASYRRTLPRELELLR